jgi:type II secretory pathway pseudopilin PulG
MLKRNSGFWTAHGFGLIDQLATLAIVGTLAAIAIPAISNAVEGQRVNMELRNVEREISLARLNAVQSNRPIRVRFNCPAAGYYRRVELLGSVTTPSAGDDADSQGVRRCSYTYYPYPAADRDPITRPNNDGPLRQLNSKVTFTTAPTLEFWPNGTAHIFQDATTTKQIDTPVNIVLSNGSTTHLIAVNGLGKMQFQ